MYSCNHLLLFGNVSREARKVGRQEGERYRRILLERIQRILRGVHMQTAACTQEVLPLSPFPSPRRAVKILGDVESLCRLIFRDGYYRPGLTSSPKSMRVRGGRTLTIMNRKSATIRASAILRGIKGCQTRRSSATRARIIIHVAKKIRRD